jgi:plastocyanin
VATFEHIFREFARRGFDPFGYGEEDDEDDAEATDDYYTATSSEPIELTVVIADGAWFDPDELTVEIDRSVRLTVDNADGHAHDFTIENILLAEDPGPLLSTRGEFDVHVEVEPYASEVVEFTPLRAGIFEFRCTGCDSEGMSGTLVVE